MPAFPIHHHLQTNNCVEPVHLPGLDFLETVLHNKPPVVTNDDARALAGLKDPHAEMRYVFPPHHQAFAVDSPSARDVDDAIALGPDGTVYVHIADPTRYLIPAAQAVKEGIIEDGQATSQGRQEKLQAAYDDAVASMRAMKGKKGNMFGTGKKSTTRAKAETNLLIAKRRKGDMKPKKPKDCMDPRPARLGALLSGALGSRGSQFLPSGGHSMLPRLLTREVLSLGGALWDGSAVTVELRPLDKTFAPRVFLSRIPPPVRVGYGEASRLLGFRAHPLAQLARLVKDAPDGLRHQPWQRWSVKVNRRTSGPCIALAPANEVEQEPARRVVARTMTLACAGAGTYFADAMRASGPYICPAFAFRAGGAARGAGEDDDPIEWTTKTGRMHEPLGLADYARVTSPLRRRDDLVNHVQLKALLFASNIADTSNARTGPLSNAMVKTFGEQQNKFDAHLRRGKLTLRNYWTVERLRRDAVAAGKGPFGPQPTMLPAVVLSVSAAEAARRVETQHAVRGCAGAADVLVQLQNTGVVVGLQRGDGEAVPHSNLDVNIMGFAPEAGAVYATLPRNMSAQMALKRGRDQNTLGNHDEEMSNAHGATAQPRRGRERRTAAPRADAWNNTVSSNSAASSPLPRYFAPSGATPRARPNQHSSGSSNNSVSCNAAPSNPAPRHVAPKYAAPRARPNQHTTHASSNAAPSCASPLVRPNKHNQESPERPWMAKRLNAFARQ